MAKNTYLELMKIILNNYIYLGTDNSVWNSSYYSDSKWNIPRCCLPHTLCSRSQLDFLEVVMTNLLKSQVPGDYIEVGVWRGGISIFMKAFLKENNQSRKNVWVVDTFSGIPKTRNHYKYKDNIVDNWEDRWVATLDEVQENFRRYNLLDTKVRFIVGALSSTLKNPPFRKISLARIDVDSYESYIDVLTLIYPYIVNGGCIILDDWHLPSCQAAVMDFRRDNQIKGKIHHSFRGKSVDAHWFVKKVSYYRK